MSARTVMDVATREEVRNLVAEAARHARPGEWISAYGLEYNVFAETGIRGSLFEEAAGDKPALLFFADLHSAIATPLAMRIAGITGPHQFKEAAEIVVDGDGVPTGELREPPATSLVLAAMPELTSQEIYRGAAANLRMMAAAGITGLHAMDGDLGRLDLLRELEGNGALAARVVMPYWLRPDSDRSEWEEFAAARAQKGRRWRAGVAKFFIDGIVEAGTAWLFEPDSDGEGTQPFWPDPAVYREAVRFMSDRGFQCVTHACGDRAVHEALNAYQAAGSPPDVRHRIEHCEIIQPDDLPRFAAEGVIASMQMQHMETLPERHEHYGRRIGASRSERLYRTRELLESGAQLTLGSDWPVVRFDPRLDMAATRLRRPAEARDREGFDDQAISALDALKGYTLWPALAVGEGQEGGSLALGKRADVTVFAADPVECDADELPANEVLLTMVDGEILHRLID